MCVFNMNESETVAFFAPIGFFLLVGVLIQILTRGSQLYSQRVRLLDKRQKICLYGARAIAYRFPPPTNAVVSNPCPQAYYAELVLWKTLLNECGQFFSSSTWMGDMPVCTVRSATVFKDGDVVTERFFPWLGPWINGRPATREPLTDTAIRFDSTPQGKGIYVMIRPKSFLNYVQWRAQQTNSPTQSPASGNALLFALIRNDAIMQLDSLSKLITRSYSPLKTNFIIKADYICEFPTPKLILTVTPSAATTAAAVPAHMHASHVDIDVDKDVVKMKLTRMLEAYIGENWHEAWIAGDFVTAETPVRSFEVNAFREWNTNKTYWQSKIDAYLLRNSEMKDMFEDMERLKKTIKQQK